MVAEGSALVGGISAEVKSRSKQIALTMIMKISTYRTCIGPTTASESGSGPIVGEATKLAVFGGQDAVGKFLLESRIWTLKAI